MQTDLHKHIIYIQYKQIYIYIQTYAHTNIIYMYTSYTNIDIYKQTCVH